MNNFIYSVLLIWVKALHLADTDCTVPDVANAYVNKDNDCKDITMACQRGYTMQSLLTCKKGHWIFEEPVCEIVQCLGEPEIINGTLDTEIMSRNFGDQYEFDCDPNFIKNGNKGTVTCTETGEWEANITCEVQCLGEPEIINGTLDIEIMSGNFGDQYEFDCDLYFFKNGIKGTVTCTETGEWEANITCEDCLRRGEQISPIFTPTFADTEDLCKQSCGSCSIVEYLTQPNVNGDNCYLYYLPILDKYEESLAECIQKCKDIPDCLTMSYYGSSSFCLLFSKTVFGLLATPGFGKDFSLTSNIIEKGACPALL